MTKRLLLSSLVFVALVSPGCLHLKKGPAQDASPSSEVEGDFRRRSIEKRTSELVAQGMAANAARAQAEDEFRTRYGTIGTPAK